MSAPENGPGHAAGHLPQAGVTVQAVIFNPVVQMAALKQPVDYARFRAFFPG